MGDVKDRKIWRLGKVKKSNIPHECPRYFLFPDFFFCLLFCLLSCLLCSGFHILSFMFCLSFSAFHVLPIMFCLLFCPFSIILPFTKFVSPPVCGHDKSSMCLIYCNEDMQQNFYGHKNLVCQLRNKSTWAKPQIIQPNW